MGDATIVNAKRRFGVESRLSAANVSNGWIADDDETVFIYYASSDTRQHVAISSIDKLLDYVINTPEDGLHSTASVEILNQIIDNNLKENSENIGLEKTEKKIQL